MAKKKYAAVGTGGRIPMFIDPIADTYRDVAEVVGLCDTSLTRRTWHQKRLMKQYGYPEVASYPAEDFDRMLAEQKPDVVIVCVPDYLHSDYIVRALDAGCDVITEKPLTIDETRCGAIFDAVKRTGRHVRTSFNYRWAPGATKIRELISGGAIGKVVHVDFEYMLNTSHGADYYRRWHSQKECSGGLLIHKSTHHFDLINWWIDAIPESVYALGRLAFYGKDNAVARGQEALTRYPRYTGVPEAKDDPFAMHMDQDPTIDGIYYKAEADSGYIRDKNVFRDGINIEDTMSAIIRYRDGVVANYSLNSFCPCEGYRVSFTGDAGRIEYIDEHASHIITGDTELKVEQTAHKPLKKLTLQKLFSEVQEIEIIEGVGGHGGGDPLIQEQMFSANPPHDPFGRNAAHEQGAASILVGVAANRSMKTGQPVSISGLFPLAPGAVRLGELA